MGRESLTGKSILGREFSAREIILGRATSAREKFEDICVIESFMVKDHYLGKVSLAEKYLPGEMCHILAKKSLPRKCFQENLQRSMRTKRK